MENPEPVAPLYLHPQRCQTCGKYIAQIIENYIEEIKKLTGNEPTTLPIRTINHQKLMLDNAKTAEGKILDKLGVIRYCCRKDILSQP